MARLESSEHGWHAARISLAGEVASRYVSYRACQLTLHAIAADAKSRDETSRITTIAAQAGFSAPVDDDLARASAAETNAGLAAQQAVCAITRKSLVTLTGIPEETLLALLQRAPQVDTLPVPTAFSVDSLPVALLAQRPDLAAAERALAATSADIGVATANRYPRLALIGNLTRDKSGDNPAILSKPWMFGPTLSLPILDGGALAAQQDAASARHAQALARYRQAVRGAVEEVETVLVNLEAARSRAEHARIATAGFDAYFKAAEQNWRAGGISLLALEDARRLASPAQRNEISLQRDRVLYWIALYKALGGGWQATVAQEINPSNGAAPAVNLNGAGDQS